MVVGLLVFCFFMKLRRARDQIFGSWMQNVIFPMKLDSFEEILHISMCICVSVCVIFECIHV